MNRPKPDWAGKTKQPKGSAGPKPRPNGRPVAEKPEVMQRWHDSGRCDCNSCRSHRELYGYPLRPDDV